MAALLTRRAFDTTDWSTNHEQRFALVRKLYDLFVANEQRLVDVEAAIAGRQADRRREAGRRL